MVEIPENVDLDTGVYQTTIRNAASLREDPKDVCGTLKIGKDPRTLKPDAERGHYVVPTGYRGIQQATVPPGTYYINPYVESITPGSPAEGRSKTT